MSNAEEIRQALGRPVLTSTVRWLKQNACQPGESAALTTTESYWLYQNYCEREKRELDTPFQFAHQLKQAGFTKKIKQIGGSLRDVYRMQRGPALELLRQLRALPKPANYRIVFDLAEAREYNPLKRIPDGSPESPWPASPPEAT